MFGLFGSDARGALVKDGVSMKEFGNTVDVFMCVVEVLIGGMAEALMPKESFRSGFYGEDWSIELGDALEWE